MNSPSGSVLEALEQRVLRSLAGHGDVGLEVLGYGEVTTVLGLDEGQARFAVKRLPLFRDRAEVEGHVRSIQTYIDGLGACGLQVVSTELRVLPMPDGRQVLYLVQPRLEPDMLGPGYMRGLDEPAALQTFGRIFDALERSVGPTLAPDGQLANWAFVDDALVYLDVSTPFMRHPDGSLAADWSFFVRTMPRPLRPMVRSEIPGVVQKYCNLRHQVQDFLANLKKERLQHLIPPLLDEANRRLDAPPLSLEAIDRYYVQDARTYATLQGVRRGHRWLTQKLLRRPYPVLLPPPIQR